MGGGMDSQIGMVRNEKLGLYQVIRRIFTNIDFINLCVIKTVHNRDFVDVTRFYIDDEGEESVIRGVRLLHLGTARCMITVEPDVGDYVLLLSPRDFVEKMPFNRTAEDSKLGFEPYAECNAVGILVNSDMEDEKDVLTTLSVDLDGNITFDTNGKVSATIGKDDDDVTIGISTEDGVSVKDHHGNSVLINSEGMSATDTNGNAVRLSSDGVSVSTDGKMDVESTKTGLITLKNSVDSLGNIIATLIDHVSTFSQNVQTLDTVGSPTAQSAGPGIIANMVALQAQLTALKQTAGQVLG